MYSYGKNLEMFIVSINVKDEIIILARNVEPNKTQAIVLGRLTKMVATLIYGKIKYIYIKT